MKIRSFVLYVVVNVLAAACSIENGLEQDFRPEYEVEFTAHMENSLQTRADIETSYLGKPNNFWKNGDKISVYSSRQTSGTILGFEFSTALSDIASSAVFGYAGDDFIVGDTYIAVYPHKTATRAVNFTAQPDNRTPKNYEGDAYRVAQVEIPSSQTFSTDGIDRSSRVMLACSNDTTSFEFKNAVALVKFKVTDPDIVSGRISAAEKISGIYRADILAETLKPIMVDYGKTTFSYVDFTASGGTPLTPGVEYYVAVRPTQLTEGFKVFLNGVEVMSYPEINEFKRNTIYDLGTLNLLRDKVLTFDFTDAAAMALWPNNPAPEGAKTSDLMNAPYVLDGVTYNFTCANPLGASKSNFPYFDAENSYLFIKQYRYIGLPAIENYKLSKVVLVNGSKAKSTREVGITTMLAKQDGSSNHGQAFLTGGESLLMQGDPNTEAQFNLSNTAVNTVYWLRVSPESTALKGLMLTYTECEPASELNIRVGTYNLMVAKSSDTGENAWSKRKSRLIESIYDNNFDVFGVNECNDAVAQYITAELQNDYNIKLFNPYSLDGEGDEGQGLVYRKSFTLLDWHYFWLSETPDVMVANDPNGTSIYNRGGCCGTLVHNDTGIKFFVMVTHGAKNMTVRDQYANLYIEMENKYNPNNYPSFFVGDMNARPGQNSVNTYLTHWNDVYLEVDTGRIGPYSTYNGLDTSLDLNADPRRIDYIYYKESVPLNYVCNDKTYGGYYASDHLPIYSDMLITNTP